MRSTIQHAVRANLTLSTLSIFISVLTSYVISRSLTDKILAEYFAMLGIINLIVLLSDSGGNAAYIQYSAVAKQQNARWSLFTTVLRKRLLVSLAIVILVYFFNTFIFKYLSLKISIDNFTTLSLISLISVATIVASLCHSFLLSIYSHKESIVIRNIFTIIKSLGIIILSKMDHTLDTFLYLIMIISLIETFYLIIKIRNHIVSENVTMNLDLKVKTNAYGKVILADKLNILIGSGSIIILFLSSVKSYDQLASLGLANDYVQKVTSLLSIPLGNIIIPYLGNSMQSSKIFKMALKKVAIFSNYIFLLFGGLIIATVSPAISFIYSDYYLNVVFYAYLMMLPIFFETWTRSIFISGLIVKNKHISLFLLFIGQTIAFLFIFIGYPHIPMSDVLIVVGSIKVIGCFFILLLAHQSDFYVIKTFNYRFIVSVALSMTTAMIFIDSVMGIAPQYILLMTSILYFIFIIILLKVYFRIEKEVIAGIKSIVGDRIYKIIRPYIKKEIYET